MRLLMSVGLDDPTRECPCPPFVIVTVDAQTADQWLDIIELVRQLGDGGEAGDSAQVPGIHFISARASHCEFGYLWDENQVMKDRIESVLWLADSPMICPEGLTLREPKPHVLELQSWNAGMEFFPEGIQFYGDSMHYTPRFSAEAMLTAGDLGDILNGVPVFPTLEDLEQILRDKDQ